MFTLSASRSLFPSRSYLLSFPKLLPSLITSLLKASSSTIESSPRFQTTKSPFHPHPKLGRNDPGFESMMFKYKETKGGMRTVMGKVGLGVFYIWKFSFLSRLTWDKDPSTPPTREPKTWEVWETTARPFQPVSPCAASLSRLCCLMIFLVFPSSRLLSFSAFSTVCIPIQNFLFSRLTGPKITKKKSEIWETKLIPSNLPCALQVPFTLSIPLRFFSLLPLLSLILLSFLLLFFLPLHRLVKS